MMLRIVSMKSPEVCVSFVLQSVPLPGAFGGCLLPFRLAFGEINSRLVEIQTWY